MNKHFLFRFCSRLLFLLPVVGLTNNLSAQNIDSLYRVVATMPDDTNRVMTYRQLFRALYAEDRKDALLEVSDKGLVLSRKLQFERGIDLFIFYKASALDILGRGLEAIPLFEEGLAIAVKNNDHESIADYHNNLGTAYHGMGALDEALEHFLAAYTHYKQVNQLEHLSKALNNIGIIYRNQGKHEKAEAIFLESLSIKKTLKDTLGIAASHQNLAGLYSTGKRMEIALEHQQKAIAIYEALGRTSDAATCSSLLGQILYNFGNLPSAKTALLKAVAYYETKPNLESTSSAYRLLAKIAIHDKDYPAAKKNQLIALQNTRKFGQRDQTFELLRELAQTEFLLGNHPEAYRILLESYTLRDSIAEETRSALMEEMQTKFEVAQKDNQLKINQLDLKQRTLERNWFVIGAALLGFLSLAIFVGLRNRIRANKKIAAQESAIQHQQIIQLEQTAKLTALNAMIEGQEQERSRIAADLHDGLGGLLTSVKSHFNTLPPTNQSSQVYEKTNQLIDDACGEVRRIAHNMMPRALAIAGLSGALDDLAHDLSKQGITCQLEIINLDHNSLKANQAIIIYRIIQELSNNVVKHAGANHMLLQLIRHDDKLTIIAEDNGKGFDVARARMQKGLGLSSIESRVKFLQGDIDWDSTPGQGSTVSISIPI